MVWLMRPTEDRRCTMTIDCNALTDSFSWYQIWTIGVALNGICIRSGHGGYQTHLGRSRYASDRDATDSSVSRSA